jgi:retron-type reverse transcriptase
MRFLEHRISDPNLLRIVHRFLKAGVMEDGVFAASDEGAPQGGLVSPVLSNLYLHYVLDLWFEKRLARECMRIPMNSATQSEGNRPSIPKETGH